MQVLVLHGPNLNLLGTRARSVDDNAALGTIDADLATMATKAGLTLQSFQSNHEAALTDRIQDAGSDVICDFGAAGYSLALSHALSRSSVAD